MTNVRLAIYKMALLSYAKQAWANIEVLVKSVKVIHGSYLKNDQTIGSYCSTVYNG